MGKVINGARIVRGAGGNFAIALGRGRKLDVADLGESAVAIDDETGGLAGEGPGAVSTLFLARLDRAARVASITNPLTRTPMTPVPAWVADAAYLAGAWCSNDGNEYVARIGGTAAASGGPTGRSLADIADNTVRWQYIQPQRATTTAADAPTITAGAANLSADLTRKFRAIEEAACFAFYGGTPVASSANGVVFPAISSILAGTVVTTTPGKDNVNPAIQFVTDAQVLSIESGSTLTSQRRFTIEIDGVLFRDSPVVGQGSTSERFITIDFTGKGRKARTIKVYWRRGAPEEFRAVYVSAMDNVWAPPSGPKLIALGDSHAAGSVYGGSQNSGDDVASRLAMYLGIDNVTNIGQGSAGFTVTLGGQRYKFGERLADATAPSPNVLVILGCHNDSEATYEELYTEILSYLTRFREACPESLIVGFSTWKGLARSEAQLDTMDAAMRNAFAALNDPLAVFRSTRSWLRGRKTAAVTGISKATSAVINVANDAAIGDMVVLYNVLGMTEINGLIGRVTAASPSALTVSINSTAFGTFSTSASSFVVINDQVSSADGIHLTQPGVNMNAQRYAMDLREVFATLSQKLTG